MGLNNENRGLNPDVKIVGDIIYLVVKDITKPTKLIFTSTDFPNLKDFKFKEIRVSLIDNNSDVGGSFSVSKSTKDTLYLTLNLKYIDELKLITYHELTHALQFVKVGKKLTSKGVLKLKPSNLVGNYDVFNVPEIKDLTYNIYYTSKQEINAKVGEIYGLKGVATNKSIYKLYKEILISKRLMTYNIFEEFKEVDEEIVRYFFTSLKTHSKKLSTNKFKSILFIIGYFFKFHEEQPLPDNEIIDLMGQINKTINNNAKKLYRKLIKVMGEPYAKIKKFVED